MIHLQNKFIILNANFKNDFNVDFKSLNLNRLLVVGSIDDIDSISALFKLSKSSLLLWVLWRNILLLRLGRIIRKNMHILSFDYKRIAYFKQLSWSISQYD